MTIRVLSIKPAKEVVKKVACKNCGARLAYTPSDVKEQHGTDIGGGPDGCEWIVCPNCKKQVILRSW